jgi:hypothetical protein
MASDRGRRREGRRGRGRHSPLAQAHAWLAWRGSARAADQGQPGEDFTVAVPGAPHLGHFHRHCTSTTTTTDMHIKHRERIRWGIEIGGDRSQQNPSGVWPKISSERRGFPNPLGGGGRGQWGDRFSPGGGGGDRRRRSESARGSGGD